MQTLADALGVPADSRLRKYARNLGHTTRGYTRQGTGIVHVLDAQNIETAAHEIGHVLDQAFDLQQQADVRNMVQRMLADPLRRDWIEQYAEVERPAEAIAEYVRYWMLDHDQAVSFGGQDFTDAFERQLQSRGWLAPMRQAATDTRLNRAATAGDRAKASIRLSENEGKRPDFKTQGSDD